MEFTRTRRYVVNRDGEDECSQVSVDVDVIVHGVCYEGREDQITNVCLKLLEFTKTGKLDRKEIKLWRENTLMLLAPMPEVDVYEKKQDKKTHIGHMNGLIVWTGTNIALEGYMMLRQRAYQKGSDVRSRMLGDDIRCLAIGYSHHSLHMRHARYVASKSKWLEVLDRSWFIKGTSAWNNRYKHMPIREFGTVNNGRKECYGLCYGKHFVRPLCCSSEYLSLFILMMSADDSMGVMKRFIIEYLARVFVRNSAFLGRCCEIRNMKWSSKEKRRFTIMEQMFDDTNNVFNWIHYESCSLVHEFNAVHCDFVNPYDVMFTWMVAYSIIGSGQNYTEPILHSLDAEITAAMQWIIDSCYYSGLNNALQPKNMLTNCYTKGCVCEEHFAVTGFDTGVTNTDTRYHGKWVTFKDDKIGYDRFCLPYYSPFPGRYKEL